jgi:hypothetical protein
LIAESSGIIISNSTVEVPVVSSMSTDEVGGLVGSAYQELIIYNSAVTSPIIFGVHDVGGLVGIVDYSFDSNYVIIEKSFVLTNLQAEYNVGGLIGYAENDDGYTELNIVNSYAIVTIVALGDAGGLIGKYETDDSESISLITVDNSFAIINSAYVFGSGSGGDYLSGIFGELDGDRFTKVYINNTFAVVEDVELFDGIPAGIVSDRDALMIPKNVYFLNELVDGSSTIIITGSDGFNRDLIGLNKNQFEESFLKSSTKFLFKDLWDSEIWQFGALGQDLNLINLDFNLSFGQVYLPQLITNPINLRTLFRHSIEMIMSENLNSVVLADSKTDIMQTDITAIAKLVPEFYNLIMDSYSSGEDLSDVDVNFVGIDIFYQNGYKIDYEIIVENGATGAFTLDLNTNAVVNINSGLATGTYLLSQLADIGPSNTAANKSTRIVPVSFTNSYGPIDNFEITVANNPTIKIRPVISNDGFKTKIYLFKDNNNSFVADNSAD